MQCVCRCPRTCSLLNRNEFYRPILLSNTAAFPHVIWSSVSQPPGPGINYSGPREILLELITNLNVILYLSTCHTVHIIVLILFMIMP